MPPVNGPLRDIGWKAVQPWHHGLLVKNSTGGTLAAGTLVYVSGTTKNPSNPNEPIIPTVAKADADGAVPSGVATHVITETIKDGATGYAAKYFVHRAQDTSTYTTVGDPVYLHTTAGSGTPTRPTGATANKQRVGYCAQKSATAGILVYDLFSSVVEEWGSNSVGGIAGSNTAVIADQAGGAVAIANFGVGRVSLTIPAGVTGNVDFTGWPYKTRVRYVTGYKTNAAGGGGGTVQVFNGTGGNAITDAISINVADKTVIEAATLDDAFIDIAAGATVRVVRTRTLSTDESCVLTLHIDRVA